MNGINASITKSLSHPCKMVVTTPNLWFKATYPFLDQQATGYSSFNPPSSTLQCGLHSEQDTHFFQLFQKKLTIQMFISIFGFSMENAFKMNTNKPIIGPVVLGFVKFSLKSYSNHTLNILYFKYDTLMT